MSKKTHDQDRYPKTKYQPKQFKEHTNKHHPYSVSRFVLKKRPILHKAWHNIFDDLTPEEAMKKVDGWRLKRKDFIKEVLDNEKRRKSWKRLFGDLEFDGVLRVIREEWTFPGFKMIKLD